MDPSRRAEDKSQPDGETADSRLRSSFTMPAPARASEVLFSIDDDDLTRLPTLDNQIGDVTWEPASGLRHDQPGMDELFWEGLSTDHIDSPFSDTFLKELDVAFAQPSVSDDTAGDSPDLGNPPARSASGSSASISSPKPTPEISPEPGRSSSRSEAPPEFELPTPSVEPLPHSPRRKSPTRPSGRGQSPGALPPKRVRRPKIYKRPSASTYCHICQRSRRLVVCSNLRHGSCRKSICQKCFERFDLGVDYETALARSAAGCEAGERPSELEPQQEDLDSAGEHGEPWVCCHCDKRCPVEARCVVYSRSIERRRVKAYEIARANECTAATREEELEKNEKNKE